MNPPTAARAQVLPANKRLRASPGERIGAGIIALVAFALLFVAARLSPDPAGMGTHHQLGLPRCGMMLATGYPCPTCGMTTAFSHAAHLQPLQAIKAQPFGAFLALCTSVVFWGGLHVAVFASQLAQATARLLRPQVLWPLFAAAIASWAYKIAQVGGWFI